MSVATPRLAPSPPPAPRHPRPVITAAMLRRRRQTLRVWARNVVHVRLSRLERELERLQRVPGAETIHDTRVATRRLRSALRHLEPCFMAQEAERLRVEVRRIARLLGQVRDLDILRENLAADARRKGSPLATLLHRLASRRQKTLERAIPEAHKLRAHLNWWRTHLRT